MSQDVYFWEGVGRNWWVTANNTLRWGWKQLYCLHSSAQPVCCINSVQAHLLGKTKAEQSGTREKAIQVNVASYGPFQADAQLELQNPIRLLTLYSPNIGVDGRPFIVHNDTTLQFKIIMLKNKQMFPTILPGLQFSTSFGDKLKMNPCNSNWVLSNFIC